MIVATDNLSKEYDGVYRVQELDIRIKEGDIYGFLGPNGAGKSTTMKMLLGLTAPTKGSFTIDGKQFPADRIAILKEVGSFIESPSFYANLTGRENLDVIRRILGLPKSAVEDALDLVGLTEFGDRLAKKYSLGMKQKIYLIAAFLSGARNLLLDEPFNGLDPESAAILKKMLIQSRDSGCMVLFSVHNLDLVANFCDEVLFITRDRKIISAVNPKNYALLENEFFHHCV